MAPSLARGTEVEIKQRSVVNCISGNYTLNIQIYEASGKRIRKLGFEICDGRGKVEEGHTG